MTDTASQTGTELLTVTVGTDDITSMKAQWSNDKLSVLATNTEGAAGGPVHVDYGSGSYDMANVGENRWELINQDVTEHGYIDSVRIWSDGGADVTRPVEEVVATCDVDVNGTYIEVENFTGSVSQGTATFNLIADASVNGGYYLFSNGGVAGSTPSNEIKEYLVNFSQAGTYYVWMRGNQTRTPIN